MTQPDEPTRPSTPDAPRLPPPAPPPARPRHRLAIIGAVVFVLLAAIVATIVLLTRGPSLGDISGRWRSHELPGLSGATEALVVDGKRFTIEFYRSVDGATAESGLTCSGRVEVDGDGYILVTESGPCGDVHATLAGNKLVTGGRNHDRVEVDLFRQ